MDPDAPTRVRKLLHDLDKEDEQRLLKFIFKHMRAGQLDVGQELAQKLGFHWLAAALDGWRLHHDPNYHQNDIQDTQLIEGNARRDLWKYVCWENAKLPDTSPYERAVFGVLSANVEATIPVCQKWTDKLWAYYRASVDVAVEKELRNTQAHKPVTARTVGEVNQPFRSSVELPVEYWANYRTDADIFHEVDALMTLAWSPEEKCHSLMQRYIAVNDVDALLDVMVSWIDEHSADQCYTQMLRFFAHLALFLQNIDVLQESSRQDRFVTIVEGYVDFLIEKRMLDLIATYVATLPKDKQISNYAKLLKKVTDSVERAACVRLAQDAGLDIDEITQVVVQASIPTDVQADIADIARQPLQTKATPEDLEIISALDWLQTNNRKQFIELLKHGNALLRAFSLVGKLDAARTVISRLPVNILEGVHMEWRRKTGQEEVPVELSNLLRENSTFKMFFDAMDMFDQWLRYFHNSKPLEPIKPTSKKFAETVAYDLAMKGYENDLIQWKNILADNARAVAAKIVILLSLPDGGIFKENAPSADQHRQEQLSALRKQYVPQLTFIAHTVLHSSNCVLEAIQLADLIASSEHKLYEEFSQYQLQDVLRRLRESSVSSLNSAKDALGYEKSSSA